MPNISQTAAVLGRGGRGAKNAVASIGLKGLAAIQSLALCVWMYYFFWHVPQNGSMPKLIGFFTPDRIHQNVGWIIIFYLAVGVVASVATNYEQGWKISSTVANIGTSFIAAVFAVLTLYAQHGTMAERGLSEVGLQIFTLTWVELILSLMVGFALARRQISYASGDV